MGSKILSVRIPDDLAQEFKRECANKGMSTTDMLKKLVDDMIYPASRLRERLGERDQEEASEALPGVMVMLAEVQAQLDNLEKQVKGFDERLELVRVDRGLTEADKEHYDKELDEQGTAIQKAQAQLKELLTKFNANVKVCNQNFQEWGDKVSRLFQYLDAHTHGPAGSVVGPKADLFDREVKLADKRLGELVEEAPQIIQGRTTRKGYRHLEYLNLSIKE